MAPKAKEDDFNPMETLDKNAVFQQCRAFNDRDLDIKKCSDLITKIIYLMQRGEQLTGDEPTTLFFGGTKLLQSQDPKLRRLVYLFFREISNFVPVGERIIVTSTLMNGMRDKNEINRSNSIRVLAHVLDPEMFGGEIERKLKESVVEKSDTVSSAALVSGMILLARGVPLESIRRWAPEVTSGLQSRSATVQMHALSLIWAMRKTDRLAVSKLAHQLCGMTLRSIPAQCLRLRIISRVLAEEGVSANAPLLTFLNSTLSHPDDAMNLEAARILCGLSLTFPSANIEIGSAVSVLSALLSSSTRTPTQLAVLRTLNAIALTHPHQVEEFNSVIDGLVSDDNRSVATLALTTLLKTATSDSDIEALMQKTAGLMEDMAEEFKIVVIKATKSLCLKFPDKILLFLNFLKNIMGEVAGHEFKESILTTITDITSTIPQAKAPGIEVLCEFIEDCEHYDLIVRVLHLLGSEAPNLTNPELCVRVIFNRIVLDNAVVRAAAVDSLAMFGVAIPRLREQVSSLLSRCLSDSDDEVRGRASLHLLALTNPATNPVSQLLTQLAEPMDVNFETLESLVRQHLETSIETPIPFSDALAQAKAAKNAASQSGKSGANAKSQATGPTNVVSVVPSSSASSGPAKPAAPTPTVHAGSILASTPDVAIYGAALNSTKPLEVTESDSDYAVTCVKHLCAAHLILQFEIRNNVESQQLESVFVESDASQCDGISFERNVACAQVLPNGSAHCFVVFNRDANALPQGTLTNTLKFHVKDVDPSTGDVSDDSFEDEYALEDITLSPAILMKPTPITQFRAAWEGLAGHGEKVEMFILNFKSIPAAVSAVVDLIGLAPCDETHIARDGDQTKKHTLLSCGQFVPAGNGEEARVLCITNFALDPSGSQVHIRVCARAKAQVLCDVVVGCVG